MSVRRAKIVCTVGPAVDSERALRELIEAGMDVARLNYSHGLPAEHASRAERIRRASAELGRPVALLQDLSGPKIRTGTGGPVELAVGDSVELESGSEGSDGVLAIDYEGLAEDVQEGDRILLGDGHVELCVTGRRAGRVVARVEHGGPLRDRMGVNLPSGRVRLGAITEKDERDLAHGLDMGVDYVALSFVRSDADVRKLRSLCQAHGYVPPIVAKIETPAAVENLDAIVDAADAVMVARGDLGVELPPESVPIVQRQILGACRVREKSVIVATEMLHSMIEAPRPTRAEASDVAGAVFGGADAVMLSGETATGAHPLAACRMMARIIVAAEASQFHVPDPSDPGPDVPDSIAHAACQIAREVGAPLIVALTQSGTTARLVSKARPSVPVVAFSPDEGTLRRLALYWGVSPRPLEVVTDIDVLVQRSSKYLSETGLAEVGDSYVLVYGAPVGHGGSTNALRVERVT